MITKSKFSRSYSLTLTIFCSLFLALSAQAQDFSAVAKEAIPAVVSIKTKVPQTQGMGLEFGDPFGNDELFQFFFGRPRRGMQQKELPPRVGQGSGFLVSADGYIMTNSHVVRDATDIEVVLNNGREYKAKLIGHDPTTDVALVKIDAQGLPFLRFGSSSKLQVGEWAIAVGNPLGLQASLTVGVISATGRANLDVADLEDFIQTDAAINRGNSGGPLMNINGEVIGINTAIASNTGGYMGIGFAIPSDMAVHILEQLRDKGSVTRGFLGVVLQPVTYDMAEYFHLDQVEGAVVAEVQDDSPAAEAGLKRGDIILSYNGRDVESVSSLRNAVSLTNPGGKIRLKVLRDNKTMQVTVEVGKHPTLSAASETVKQSALGLSVSDLTNADRRRLSLESGQSGVLVTDVQSQSPADQAGLKKDAVILEMNRQRLGSADQFLQQLRDVRPGSRVLLLVKQGEVTAYVVLTAR